MRQLNRFSIGLLVGLALALMAVLTNVVFPSPNVSDDQVWWPIAAAYVILFICWGVSGYVDSRHGRRLKSGALAGATTAVISTALIMLAFIAIDNLFFDIVKQQVDKMTAFHNQSAYQDMRAFVNSGDAKALVIGLPVAGLIGACCGTIGAGVRRITV